MEILAVQAMRVLDTETTRKGDVVKKSPSFVIPLSVITVLATALLLSNKARLDQTSESTGHPSKPYQTNVLVYTVDYANQTNTYRDMMAHKSDINMESDVAFQVQKDGSLKGTAPKATGILRYACVENLTNGTFDPKMIGHILHDASLSKKLQDNLIKLALTNGYAGIQLDFEQLHPNDEMPYVHFLKSLHQKTQQRGISLSVAISPSIGNDQLEKGIGDNADQVVLMTYDYSYPGSHPGAVAPTWWVKSVLDYETAVIPRDKIFLGINAYGYTWGNSKGTAVGLVNVDKVNKKYHATEHFDTVNDAPYSTYQSNNKDYVFYYENQQSLTDKMNLAKAYGLHGIAIWRIGLENDELWKAVEAYKKQSLESSG
jgi:spore germination protein